MVIVIANKTSEYWKKRFEILETASNSYGLDTYRQIEPAFEVAQRQIEKEIEVWFARFGKNNGVTIDEAKKYLTTAELKEFKWDVEEYIRKGRENALNQQWVKELENASSKYHISRLEALKIRTQNAAEVAFGNELDEIDAMARRVYTDNYYRSIFEVQKGFNIGWDIGQVDEKKLSRLISKPWAADGKNFSERIWGQRTQLVNELHQQLTRTCVLGKPPDSAIEAIAKKFDVTKNQAGRLVMTEQAYFHSISQKDAFNELDVEEFEIVATLDSHTSSICQEMDGQHFPMKEYEPGVTAPPFHVWCRSVTVPYFDDDFLPGERAARDAEGNTYYVPDNMTYKEWKEQNVKAESERYTREDYENIGKAKVDFSIFDSERWNDNFDLISNNSEVNSSIKRVSKQMLKHRSGTFHEDLYFIDANTGKIAGFNTSDSKKLGVTVNERIQNALNNQNITLIGIHNHPYSSLPSLSDLNAIAKRSNQVMGVIVCHDGTIFTYSKPVKEINETAYKTALTKFKKYSIITNENKGMEFLSDLYEFEFRRFEI